MTDAALSSAPRERGWRRLLPALLAFLVVPGTVQPEASPIRVRTGFGAALRTFVLRRLNLVDRR